MPRTEDEIKTLIPSGGVEEGPMFDAKTELPSKNRETAKDIAAMANDGGVIIYGIAEDEGGRPTVLNPIPLDGARERLGSIARTAIQEPVNIQSWSIPTQEDPSIGYVVLVIPPSERAPHMVTVDKTNRYYGRKDTENVPLAEGDIARLYARREKVEANLDILLTEEIERSPLEPNRDLGYLHIIAQPVMRHDDLIERAVREGETVPRVLSEITQMVQHPRIFDDVYPDFPTRSSWRNTFDGYLTDFVTDERLGTPALRMEVDRDGTAHLFSVRATQRRTEDSFVLITEVVGALTARFIAFLGELYERAGYMGLVDIGVAVTSLHGAVPYTSNFIARHSLIPYESDEYRRTARLYAPYFQDDPRGVAEGLLMPLFRAGSSHGSINPFRQQN